MTGWLSGDTAGLSWSPDDPLDNDPAPVRPLTVVAFGTYQAEDHPRIRVLIEGIEAAGHCVIEINEPLGLSTADRVRMLKQPWRLPKLAGHLAARWWRLVRRGRKIVRQQPIDAVLVGYLGHFDVFLARRIFHDVPVALDHLIFAAGTAADRGTKPGLRTRALAGLDRAAMNAADVIVLDTAEHAARVPAELADRALVCAVGADEDWFSARRITSRPTGPLRVVFFGLFTPLQGAPVIGEALGLLAGRSDLRFTMIGSGQDLEESMACASGNSTVVWRDLVPAADLPALVADHDVALGIFGSTDKALEVVPNKVYQCSAAGCAVVTSDTEPQRLMLGDAALFVPPGDAAALADTIAQLAADRGEVERMAKEAADRADRLFTSRAVAAPLVDALTSKAQTASTAARRA